MSIRLHRLMVCFVVVIAVIALATMPRIWGGERPPGIPYGVVLFSGSNELGEQDLAYNLAFLRQIWSKTVAHPYRLADQQQIARAWFPRLAGGRAHAYSPVAPIIALPLLALTPEWAYRAFTMLNGILLVLLTYYFLLPRMENFVQFGAVVASFYGFVLFDVFFMGQTSILTTCLLALGFVMLSGRGKSVLIATPLMVVARRDIILAGLLYILSIKPSVALILFVMLVGERAWAALVIAGMALALTWVIVADHYGGFLTGLQDYAWLLGHYCQADMTPFLRGDMGPGISTNFTSFGTVLDPALGEAIFRLCRVLFEGLVAGLCVARWKRWISLETQFHGLLWSFLLFCPYLLVTEDFAVCLLATGAFFRPGPGAPFKILLVFLLVNSCMGQWTTIPFFFPIKLALVGWWLVDLIVFQPRLERGTSTRAEVLSSASV